MRKNQQPQYEERPAILDNARFHEITDKRGARKQVAVASTDELGYRAAENLLRSLGLMR